MWLAQTFVYALCVYAAVGLVFAAVFVRRGVQKVDEVAEGAGIGFRLIIIPGVAAFWPVLLRRWARAGVRT